MCSTICWQLSFARFLLDCDSSFSASINLSDPSRPFQPIRRLVGVSIKMFKGQDNYFFATTGNGKENVQATLKSKHPPKFVTIVFL